MPTHSDALVAIPLWGMLGRNRLPAAHSMEHFWVCIVNQCGVKVVSRRWGHYADATVVVQTCKRSSLHSPAPRTTPKSSLPSASAFGRPASSASTATEPAPTSHLGAL